MTSLPAAAAYWGAAVTRVLNCSTGPDWTMSRALPSAMRPSGSMSRTSWTRPRAESACASAPPSAPAPIIATVDMRGALLYRLRAPPPPGSRDVHSWFMLKRMVAIVTGGSKGIGLAIARAFLERGMQVAISGRNDKDLRRAAERLGSAAAVHAVVSDVRDPADAQRLIDETVARFGGVDVLVNNAGVGKFATV